MTLWHSPDRRWVRLAVAFWAAWLGCGNSPGTRSDGSGRRALGAGCVADSDCDSGFCDRTVCATEQIDLAFGKACQPGLRPVDGIRESKLYVCGPYLCVDARCRSCNDDQECMKDLGAPRCQPVQGRPGRRCGAP
jgi:hypothetical protein